MECAKLDLLYFGALGIFKLKNPMSNAKKGKGGPFLHTGRSGVFANYEQLSTAFNNLFTPMNRTEIKNSSFRLSLSMYVIVFRYFLCRITLTNIIMIPVFLWHIRLGILVNK
jgi:hypothetical protein